MKNYDCIVIGAGAAGMMAAIIAARNNHTVLLLEKLPKVAAKLKATGGGRCNLTNTLSNEEFMHRFGKEGRFMTPALEQMNHQDLQNFFHDLNVQTHAPDGFRVFPIGHDAMSIIQGLKEEMERLNIETICSQKVVGIEENNGEVSAVLTQEEQYHSSKIIIATGGKGYPVLGAEGDGYELAQSLGHTVSEIHPAMMPLKTKERWGANCRADTIAKVEMRVDIKKYKKLHAKGDLIFTKNGIRGPVVLDFSREITPLLTKYNEVPILMNLTKGMNEEEIRQHFKTLQQENPHITILELTQSLLPKSISLELCQLAEIENPNLTPKKISGISRDKLIKLLAWTPLTVNGHDGFKLAMITRGGVVLKEINPNTMESKKVKGLYFCGEVMNLDGPCGGYNLQWSFASGHLAGQLLSP
jgi:predicted Rossmann fold flavoprotein